MTLLDTGRLAAHALVCPAARYAAVRWTADRLERRHAAPLVWRIVTGELETSDWTRGLVPSDGMLVQLLIPMAVRTMVSVQYVAQLPIRESHPQAIEAVLDGYLKGVALPLDVGITPAVAQGEE